MIVTIHLDTGAVLRFPSSELTTVKDKATQRITKLNWKAPAGATAGSMPMLHTVDLDRIVAIMTEDDE